MRKVLLSVFLLFALSLNCVFMSNAEQVSFVISIDKQKVTLGDVLQLNMTFYGTQDASTPTTPVIKGFNVKFVGPSTRMSIVNGQVSSSVTYIYKLYPVNIGTFKIGPFSMAISGRNYRSNSIMVEVLRKGGLPQQTSKPLPSQGIASANIKIDQELKKRVFLVMEIGKKEAYVNEKVPINVKLYVTSLSLRDIQYPVVDYEGISMAQFEKPDQYPKVLKGIQYEILEFKSSFFGTRPGDFVIGPAHIEGNMLVQSQRTRRSSLFDDFFNDDFFSSFFKGYQIYPLSLDAEAQKIKILPLPGNGKDDKTQKQTAVGSFKMTVSVSPQRIKMGDPVTIKTEIKGIGNLNTVRVPEVEIGEDFKVYDPQVVEQTSVKKVFEQIVIPKRIGIMEIPKVKFSYFDTKTAQHKEVEKGPFTIEVIKPDINEKLKIVETAEDSSMAFTKEKFGKDIIYIKENIGKLHQKGKYLYRERIFRALLVLPVILLFVIFLVRIHFDRLRTDPKYARSISASQKGRAGIQNVNRAYKKGDVEAFYDEVFKNLQQYLGDRLQISIGGIGVDIVDNVLEKRNIEKTILKKIEKMFEECDMARYASSAFDKKAMKKTADNFKNVIEYMERNKV